MANFFVGLILGIIYQDMEKAVNIYTQLATGALIMIPFSVFLHWLALNLEKDKEKRHGHCEYWRHFAYFFALMLYLITMLQLYNSVHYIIMFFISMLGLYIISIIISANIPNPICSFGIIGKIINGIFISNYEFSLSHKIKNNFDKDREDGKRHRGEVVKRMNHINLIFSGILSIIYVCFSPNLVPYFSENHLNASILIFFAISLPLVARTVARSIEILSAFFIDTVDKERKTTSLKPNERVMLALYSLIEITLLFAAVYLFINIMSIIPTIPHITAEIDRIYFFFYSFGITTSTAISFEMISKTQSIAIVLQVITSMVLIVFTFSRYIGEIKEDSK